MIDQSPDWLKRTAGPALSYLDMLFVDHGIFRMFYLNRHRIGESRVWRSAQPAPHHIARMARKGVKTLVNLRGERYCGSYWLAEKACVKHGIRLENFQVRSRAAPSLEELRGARELFQRVEYPMWMHCKSGADRAGLMSVLYLHTREGVPIETAIKQLSLKYGHIRQADTGVLDHFFEKYIGKRTDLSSDALAAISQHEGARAVQIMIDIVESDAHMDVREEAVFWMAQSGSQEAFAYLDRLLMAD